MLKNLFNFASCFKNFQAFPFCVKSSFMAESFKKSKKIGTHSGVFHCDDALACFLVKQLPQFQNAEILRTRDDKLLQNCDIVIDVGGVYDHNKQLYDHHQRDFTHSLHSLNPKKSSEIKLSSVGLIYHHYGHEIISKLLKVDKTNEIVDKVYDKVYDGFVKEIDAIDNGVSISSGKSLFNITTDISSRVSYFLPTWKEETSEKILLEKFYQAMNLVGKEFIDRVNYYGNVWYSAKTFVEEAVKERFKFDKSGMILDLSKYMNKIPWKEHLFDIESEMKIENEIKFVICKDNEENWRVIAVPIEPKSFTSRIPLEKKWRGLRNEQLSQVSGISGCIFVHDNGFIGGNKTKLGAFQMAKKTLELFRPFE